METKICNHCKREVDIDKFGKDKNKKDGMNPCCKECIKVRTAIFNNENREKINSKGKIRYYKNNENEMLRSKKYRSNNKEKVAEYSKKYRKENKEKTSAYSKKYKNENSKVIREKARIYRLKNVEKLKLRNKIYKHANQEKSNIRTQQYRARKAKLPCTLTIKDWEFIKKYFNNKCCYCGQEKPLAQEHFIPITKNGEFTVNNIIPSCKTCNSSKSNNNFESWYKSYRYYNKKREKTILKFLGYTEEVQQLKIV